MSNRRLKRIVTFAGVIVCVLLLRVFAFTPYSIPSAGMENSLFQGECILVNKWSYGLRTPFMSLFSYHRWCERPIQKRDIVIFNNPADIRQSVIDRRDTYISRCIGVPGDTLLIDSLFTVTSSATRESTDKKPLIVPGKGKLVQVCPWNITLLRNTLVMHEGKQAEIRNDTLFVEGYPVEQCYFTKDYYWMKADNIGNIVDSRLFGFVPYDHIIGKASLIWFSKEKETGLFDGYRWQRFFHMVK